MTITEARPLGYLQAINDAVADCLRSDESVFLAGEDVAEYGSVFGIYRGLLKEFGPDRVLDTPISEAALIGLGVGAAAAGLRPIIDLMFMDFVAIAMDQLANQAAKMRYMFGGRVTVPLTVITMAGAGTSMAAQHSQSLEAWLCHVPGLKVVMPSGPLEAAGLIRTAVADPNPVVVVCNKLCLGLSTEAPEVLPRIPIGQAHVVREGRDATVVALGRLVSESIKAADRLAEDGIDIEVIDPRSISPLDIVTLVESVKKTNRAVVAHEAVRFGGFGGEIAAQLAEDAFDWLDAPIERIGAPFTPVPFSPVLEQAYLPGATQVEAAVRRTLR